MSCSRAARRTIPERVQVFAIFSCGSSHRSTRRIAKHRAAFDATAVLPEHHDDLAAEELALLNVELEAALVGQERVDALWGHVPTPVLHAHHQELKPRPPAGLLAELGGDYAQIALGMPKVVTGVFKGILLFMLLAGEIFNRYHITWRRPAGTRASSSTGRRRASQCSCGRCSPRRPRRQRCPSRRSCRR